MARSNPFNDNLAFQPKGTEQESQRKIDQAMEIIRAFCVEGTNERDVQTALGYIEDHCPKTEQFCDEIRTAFLLDDITQSELRSRLCVRAYNKLVSRMNGKPV